MRRHAGPRDLAREAELTKRSTDVLGRCGCVRLWMKQAAAGEVGDLAGGAGGLRQGHRWPGMGPSRRDPAGMVKGGGGQPDLVVFDEVP